MFLRFKCNDQILGAKPDSDSPISLHDMQKSKGFLV